MHRFRRSTSRLACTALALSLGLLTACREPLAAPETEPALGVTAAAALAFRQISAGALHSCGVTTTNQAYCWGSNQFGQLGTGTFTSSTRPLPVAGGLAFKEVRTGSLHTCGVTTTNLAFCWGNNSDGQLGNGTTVSSPVPVPVAGGHTFSLLNTGSLHTCGVTTSNAAYCWGSNEYGQLGTGTNTGPETCAVFGVPCSTQPVRVAGGRAFRMVSAGSRHTCGLSTTNLVYCWGYNAFGQLGTGTTTEDPQPTPTAVAGGRTFRQVNAGDNHTCGATTGNVAFCWGYNGHGQLGTGTTSADPQATPVRVAGRLAFRGVNAGNGYTCGETTGARAYCWGENSRGQLGDGTTTIRLTPTAVVGGLSFRMVNTEGFSTCGVTTGSVAYCWGWNRFGQLGDGTTEDRSRPTPVAEPEVAL